MKNLICITVGHNDHIETAPRGSWYWVSGKPEEKWGSVATCKRCGRQRVSIEITDPTPMAVDKDGKVVLG